MTCKCCGFANSHTSERRFFSTMAQDLLCEICQEWFQETIYTAMVNRSF